MVSGGADFELGRGRRLGVLMYGERKSSSLVLALCCGQGWG